MNIGGRRKNWASFFKFDRSNYFCEPKFMEASATLVLVLVRATLINQPCSFLAMNKR